MDIALWSEQVGVSNGHEAASLNTFLERGLACARQKQFAGALSFFALARECLSPDQAYLASTLAAFQQSYARYEQAQELLHLASKRFVEVEAEQEAALQVIERLMVALQEEGAANPFKASFKHQPSAQHPQQQEPLPSKPLRFPSPKDGSPPLERANDASASSLFMTCFGRFEVKRGDQPMLLCANRNGQVIFRYLVAKPGHRETMDVLMTLLWPEDEPTVAHHKLQVAVSALRCALNKGYESVPGGGYILCRDRVYHLNPTIALHSDVEEFLALYQAGRQSSGPEAIAFYKKACGLYRGPFLVEDLYADWPALQREQLCQTYLTMCHRLAEYYLAGGRYEDAAQWATAVLKENRCDEAAHQQLMRIYAAGGRRSEALRQYQQCKDVLAEELGAQPLPETEHLLSTILSGNYSYREEK